mgnify:CR=1 FL=1
MGLLAGFVGGAADEYAKQGDEKRKNKYQEIRDNRLAELEQGNATHRQGLVTEEAKRSELVQAGAQQKADTFTANESALQIDSQEKQNNDRIIGQKKINDTNNANSNLNYEHTLDQTVVRDGKEVHTGTRKPTAGSSANLKFLKSSVELRGPGEPGTGTLEETDALYKMWQGLAYDKFEDDYSKTYTRNDELGWVAWHNSMVIDADRLMPDDPKHMVGDPDALYERAKRITSDGEWKGRGQKLSIARLKEDYPFWAGPKDEAKPKKSGMLSQGASQDPRNTTPDETTEPVVQDTSSNAGIISQGEGQETSNTTPPGGATSPDAINGPLRKKLAAKEAELAAINKKPTRERGSKPQAIANEIANIKEMLGEV